MSFLRFKLKSSVALTVISSLFYTSLPSTSFAMENDDFTDKYHNTIIALVEIEVVIEEGEPNLSAPSSFYWDYFPGASYLGLSSAQPASSHSANLDSETDVTQTTSLLNSIIKPSQIFLNSQCQQLQEFLGSNESVQTIRNLHRQLKNSQVDEGLDFYTPLRSTLSATSIGTGPSSSTDVIDQRSSVEDILTHPFVAPLFRAYMEEMAPKVEILIRNALVLGAEEGGAFLAQKLGITQRVASKLLDGAGMWATNKGSRAALGIVAPHAAIALELYDWFKLGFVTNLSATILSHTDGLVERLLRNSADQLIDQLDRALQGFLPSTQGAQGYLQTLEGYATYNYEDEFFGMLKKMIEGQTQGLLGWLAQKTGNLVVSYSGVEESSPTARGIHLISQLVAVFGSYKASNEIGNQLTAIRENLPQELRDLLDEVTSLQKDLGDILEELREILTIMNTLKIRETGADFLRKSIRTSLIALQKDLNDFDYGQNGFLLFQSNEERLTVGDVAHTAGTANRVESTLTTALWQNMRNKSLALIPESGTSMWSQTTRYLDQRVGSAMGRFVAREAASNLEGTIASAILELLPTAVQGTTPGTSSMRNLIHSTISFASSSLGRTLADYSIELMGDQIGTVEGYTLSQLTERVLPQANSSSWSYRIYQSSTRIMEFYESCGRTFDSIFKPVYIKL